MPPITCHILDTTRGKPAANVFVSIYKLSELPKDDEELTIEEIEPFGVTKTNQDGRVDKWVFHPKQDLNSLGIDKQDWNELKSGIYKIRFHTSKYFKTLAIQDKENGITSDSRTFFPFVDIVFTVSDPPDNHYHIPLLLANHSYTTYRGS
ncbi:Transthyretin [Wickerhamomyces ciferrii]|uniref:5-hydroxyisourate hydrolase n=1 Tax=Wickerhamomyces ciferrii (strain ATCC 14091 / BCRC 22168 / CBS 111 / JCM 3599 / NBRC 0793 / NRRL Y-1031 F-60-10) TaxID=1206466 RepID=K0KJ82_WICCF|nr:Transthyretin [Wickerhamomyces ciferrii]CCH41549.1 Transthyretin [Wickerhamomyces ciferrii]